MHTIMSMAITADGFIAKSNDDTDYLSEEGWSEFNARVAEVGNIIMGRKTYDIMRADGSIEDIKDTKIVVLSATQTEGTNSIRYESTPEGALNYLKDKGFKVALLSGGAMTNAAFLSANLVDEVWLDIEPILLGKGINLLEDNKLETRLVFKGTRMLSKNVIQLRYEVVK